MGIVQLVAVHISREGGFTALHKLLGGTGVIGRTAKLFCSICQPNLICCILITRRHASVVYAAVFCLSVWCGCSILAAE